MRTYIKVIGIGGSGISTVRRMIKFGLSNIEFWCMDTDLSSLHSINCANKLQFGERTTKGTSTNGDSQIGLLAAKEVEKDIFRAIEGADVVLIVTGMGGGTGTGASPLVSNISKAIGALTIGVISEPFSFEGLERQVLAQQGIEKIRLYTDSLYVIQDDKILPFVNRRCPIGESFVVVDEAFFLFIKAIVDIVNSKHEEVLPVLKTAGLVDMGIGRATGDERDIEAAKIAINSQLLKKPINNVSCLILVIYGGKNLTPHELDNIVSTVKDSVREDTKMIVCDVCDDNMDGETQVILIGS